MRGCGPGGRGGGVSVADNRLRKEMGRENPPPFILLHYNILYNIYMIELRDQPGKMVPYAAHTLYKSDILRYFSKLPVSSTLEGDACTVP